MKAKDPKRTVFQAAITPRLLYRLRRISKYRGVGMTRVFINWIEAAYSRLPEEAK